MDTKSRSPRRATARALAVLGTAGLALAASPVHAMDTFFVGARGQGMAGSLTAAVDDTDAQYYNPAAFGFFNKQTEGGYQTENDNNDLGRKDFGFGIDAGAGARFHGHMAERLNALSDVKIDNLKDGIQSKDEAQQLMDLTSNLTGIDDPSNSLSADVNGGAAFRFGHFGLGVRVTAQADARVVNLDTKNLGFAIPVADAVTQINTNAPKQNSTPDVFTQNQMDHLVNTIQTQDSSISTTDAQNAVYALDDAAKDAGVTSQQASDAVTQLDNALQSSGSSGSGSGSGSGYTVDQNTTSVLLKGFALAEVPLSYGYALSDHLSLGVNVKAMRGRVYGNQVLVFNKNSGDVIAKTDQRYKETSNIGADVGLMGRYSLVNFGVMARNVNSPVFKGFTFVDSNGNPHKVEDVKVKPQVRAGVALIPTETLTLEVDYDLTSNETMFKNYHTKFLSAGFEWNAFHFLALRAGAYKNMAESDIGPVVTAGVGLNLWLVRLDVAGAMAQRTTMVDGHKTPKEARATAEVSFDF